MVSHSHLSAGNSDSEHSLDLFVEFGVSKPNSPSTSSPLLLSIEDMGESDPQPLAVAVSSNDSTSLGNALDVGPALGPEARDIFQAAQYFSHKDRVEAVSERAKNLKLLEFISAHGLSSNDINAYMAEGKIAKMVSARKMLDVSPQCVEGTKDPAPTKPTLVPVFCVGEDIGPVHPPSSVVSPPKNPPSPSAVIVGPSQIAGTSKSWSAVVSNPSGKATLPLSYFPPSSKEGQILIKPPADVLKRGNQLWASSLVGYFLHSKLPFKVVEPIAKRLWGNMGLQNVFLHAKGYYIFKFQSISDRNSVLASGPWHFASKIIVLQPWREGVAFSKTDRDKFPVWVKFSNIPLSYWSAEGISYIASGIGKPLFTDDLTSKLSLINYARVCIEVDASFSFPSSFNVIVMNEDSSEDTVMPIDIEYQSKPPSCPSCKVFGHSPLKCPNSNYQWVSKANSTAAAPASVMPSVPSNSPTKIATVGISIGCPTQPVNSGPLSNADPGDSTPLPHVSSANDWVTVSRGAKNGTDSAPNSLMVTTNAFSPIAPASSTQVNSDNDSPAIDHPLVSKLKVVDEKEGKDLSQKQKLPRDSLQDAKRRNKGKGKGGTLLNLSK